jgi:hypothetical protein
MPRYGLLRRTAGDVEHRSADSLTQCGNKRCVSAASVIAADAEKVSACQANSFRTRFS